MDARVAGQCLDADTRLDLLILRLIPSQNGRERFQGSHRLKRA
jgi:hypothetical protein